MSVLKISNTYPAAFEPIVRSNKHHLIAKGGRGSGKSWSCAELFVTRTMTDGKNRLCTRYVQKSIKDSAHRILADTILKHNLGYYFSVLDKSIRCYNGGEFIFRGMNDLGSLEGMQDAWVEEAQKAKKDDYELLIPTIRAEGSQILSSYNPTNEDDPIHQIAIGKDYENHRTVAQMNWSDNPWFPTVLDEERMIMKSINTNLYNHIWEGHINKIIEGAIIKPDYFGRYDKLPAMIKSQIIADTASEAKEENDYTVYMFAGLGVDGKIYIMDLWRGKVEAPDRVAKALDFWNKHKKRMGYGIGATAFKVEKAASGFDIIQHLSSKIPISGITRKRSGTPFKKKFGRLMDVIVAIAEGNVLLPETTIHYSGTHVTDAEWVDDFIKETTSFTSDDSHDYDDQVDTLIDSVSIFSNKAPMIGFVI